MTVTSPQPWKPEDGDSKCQQCYARNPLWWVSHDVWDAVMGNEGGILCPTCFMNKADALGVLIWANPLWEVVHIYEDATALVVRQVLDADPDGGGC